MCSMRACKFKLKKALAIASASACRKRPSKSWAFFEKCGKMIVKQREKREQVEIFSIEEFVPADHLLRKIDSAIDFTYIYEIVEDLTDCTKDS